MRYSSVGERKDVYRPHSEGMILMSFRQVLEATDLEPTENFFTAGGDSLKSLQVASLLHLEPTLLHAFPTARKLARFLSGSISRSKGEC